MCFVFKICILMLCMCKFFFILCGCHSFVPSIPFFLTISFPNLIASSQSSALVSKVCDLKICHYLFVHWAIYKPFSPFDPDFFYWISMTTMDQFYFCFAFFSFALCESFVFSVAPDLWIAIRIFFFCCVVIVIFILMLWKFVLIVSIINEDGTLPRHSN